MLNVTQQSQISLLSTELRYVPSHTCSLSSSIHLAPTTLAWEAVMVAGQKSQ